MLVSILHRASGTALAIGGGLIFIWWLVAAASGADAYGVFYKYVVSAGEEGGFPAFCNVLGKLVGIGLTWSFFQHMCSGIRHFVLDTGAGYELRTNKTGAIATIVVALVLTLLFWGVAFAKGGF